MKNMGNIPPKSTPHPFAGEATHTHEEVKHNRLDGHLRFGMATALPLRMFQH
jgi:hypothetical protein